MKTVKFTLLACLMAFSFFSCKKEHCPTKPSCTETSVWTGTYGSEYGQSEDVADSTFISDGVARLQNSPWYYFYTSLQLPIPECRNINADSIRFEVSLKNAPKDIGSIADYDAALWIYGSSDTAHVQYIGYRPQFTSFGLNSKQITNSNDLLYVFADWTTVSLEAKDNILTSQREGTTTATLSYDGHKIGVLKSISVSFKGSGSVDWVKIYNSKSNELLMKEDFDVNGKSSVVWY